MDRLHYTPVIIIGAPRSGTNMLRDVLTALPGMTTWPCDEINLVWRHGNVRSASDQISARMAGAGIRRYIRSKFSARASRDQAEFVVEKTCANSLRVPFVYQVLPEAYFIFITRDGYDAAASALERWRAPVDIPYSLRKARFMPVLDMPYYATVFLLNRAHRIFSRDSRVASWGPVFPGMNDALQNLDLLEVCAMQWRHCVESAWHAFQEMSRKQWIHVSYERFASDPAGNLSRICSFIGYGAKTERVEKAVAKVSPRSIGRGRAKLTVSELETLRPIIEPAMQSIEAIPDYLKSRPDRLSQAATHSKC